jgi:hypothetical protein
MYIITYIIWVVNVGCFMGITARTTGGWKPPGTRSLPFFSLRKATSILYDQDPLDSRLRRKDKKEVGMTRTGRACHRAPGHAGMKSSGLDSTRAMASVGHAWAHSPQPMQASLSTIAISPGSALTASMGQTS